LRVFVRPRLPLDEINWARTGSTATCCKECRSTAYIDRQTDEAGAWGAGPKPCRLLCLSPHAGGVSKDAPFSWVVT